MFVCLSGMLRRVGWSILTVSSYEYLPIEVKRILDVETMVMPVVVGEAGRLSSSFLKYSGNIPRKDSTVESEKFSSSGNRARDRALMWDFKFGEYFLLC